MAISIRKEFVKKRKEKVKTGSLFVADCVTLATKVRTDTRKAISHKCSNGEVHMFIISFTSRPVLQVKRKRLNLGGRGGGRKGHSMART